MKKRNIRNASEAMNAVVYCRVSTKEQVNNLSLDTQQSRGEEYCAKNGWPVVRIFRDEGASAKTTDRAEFQRMLAFCKDKKNGVGFVVVNDLSRFSRVALDQLSVMAELRGWGVNLRSVTEEITETPSGKLLYSLKAVFNEHDNDVKAERTKLGMRKAASLGFFPFKAALGYTNNGTANGPNLIPDPVRAPLITQAFEQFATGTKTTAQVLESVTQAGLTTLQGKPVSPQTFHMILRNRVYKGLVCIPKWDEIYQGNFEPLVSEELFDAVQALLTGRRQVVTAHVRNHPDFPLRVFVTCGKCGDSLTGSWSTGRSKRYAYYRCPRGGCNAVNMRAEKVHDAFTSLLLRLTPTPECLSLFKDAFRKVWHKRTGESTALVARAKAKVESAKDKKNKLFQLLYANRCPQKAFDEQLQHLEREEENARWEVESLVIGQYDVEKVTTFATMIAKKPATLWAQSALDQRQRLQKVFFPNGLNFQKKDLEPF